MNSSSPSSTNIATDNKNTIGCAEPRIKIISMGSSGVGKSCLVKRYCEGGFVSKYIPTIGIDYGVKPVTVPSPAHMSVTSSTLVIRVNFWDMAGGDFYKEIRNEFYSAAEGILLVYDVTDMSSFKALDKWVEEMEKYVNLRSLGNDGNNNNNNINNQGFVRISTRPPIVFVCANKVDNNNNNDRGGDGKGKTRVVSEAEGRQWAKKHSYSYFETSACSGLNVTEMFEALFKDVVDAFL